MEGGICGIDPFLWFHLLQIGALKALWPALSVSHGIPLVYPQNNDGTPCTTAHEEYIKGMFEGFCNHYNFTDRKIDCAGSPAQEIHRIS